MKIAIIGAGTCGLYLAWKLAKKKHEVVVFEKSNTVGEKACSGLFSERILDFVPKSKALIENEISSVLIHFPKKTVKVHFSKKFLLMSHSKLDELLSGLAKQAGVRIVFNCNVLELPTDFDRIIGCDGAASFTRKNMGLADPSLRLGIQGFSTATLKDDFVETWPCKNGFIWKIPRKENIEYGIMADTDTAYRIFNEFTRQEGINLTDIKSKIIPQGLVIAEHEKMTLCGDSAGMTKPWSGGGVIWGLIAADMLLESFPNFNDYVQKTKKFFSLKIFLSQMLIKFIYFLGFNLPFLLPKSNKIEADFIFKS
ncbi:MAG: NAD(P)-binding protein [Candidatus Staskawiczbacteria bacterium]|jgi:flavin-dependent dehydrogenase